MWKPNHKGRPAPAISEAELIARYTHLVDVLPSSVSVKAHTAVFTDLPVEERTELLDRLHPFMPDAAHDATAEEPGALAMLVRDAEPRDAMMGTALAGVVAARFLQSTTVVAYFTDGAGSVTIDEQPQWVSELAHHESVPIDAGTLSHKSGIDFRPWA